MKRIIRNAVFESNSSSTHSFTYGSTYNDLIVDEYDNCVHTNIGEFGWEVVDYCNSKAKLDYIILVAAHFCNSDFWYCDDVNEEIKYLKESEHYKKIEEVVKDVMNCDGIVIEDNANGYIDHQSLGYNSFEDWLEDTCANSVEEFIFGNIELHTDNDNH